MRPRHSLLLAIPAAVALEWLGAPALVVFGVAAFALLPSAFMMTTATEELADRSGPGVGGLLNVTFGNGPELILAFFALAEGLHELVKASLVGSILGNVLLVLGVAMIAGGWRREKQRFNRTAVQAYAGMLLLATGALVLPSLLELARGTALPHVGSGLVEVSTDVEALSIAVAVILLVSYALGMVFALETHRRVLNPRAGETAGGPLRAPLLRLGLAAALVAVTSEVLVGTIEESARALGVSQFFLGVTVVAVVGNAAEHWAGVASAARGDMNLTMSIALGSSAQVALVVAPVLALASLALAHPLALVFNPYELAALLLAVLVSNYLTLEGESNWFEGVQLVALYLALGVLFLLA